MKNIIKSFIIFAAVALVLNSCGDPEPIIYDGPLFVSFTGGTSGHYFVQEGNTPFPVQVGIPSPVANDVTVQIELISATGEEGTQFDLPSSVTIRAGEVISAVPVKGYFEHLAGRKDTISFQLVGDEVANFDTAYTLILQQFCTFDINTFTGPYSCDEEGYGVYEVNFTIDTTRANAILNDNFWNYAAPGQKLQYVFTGDFDQVVIIPEQEFTFGDGYVGSVVGQGTYDGCSGTMVVDYLVNWNDERYGTRHIFTPGAPVGKSALIKKGK